MISSRVGNLLLLRSHSNMLRLAMNRMILFLYFTIVFVDHDLGDGAVINPGSILKIRIQRNEAAWAELRFKSNARALKTYCS